VSNRGPLLGDELIARLGHALPPSEHHWTAPEAALYALAVGAGRDCAAELAFTVDRPGQLVLPTYAALLWGGWPELRTARPRGIAAEDSIVLYGRIPAEGRIRSSRCLTGVREIPRGLLVTIEARLVDATTERPLARLEKTILVPGARLGHDASEHAPSSPGAWSLPESPPDATRTYQIRPEQAQLFRLTGDRNPLHVDQEAAHAAGFDRPIVHGLCTFGIAGRALLDAVCAMDIDAFGAMGCRYSSPLFPGERLQVHIWSGGRGATFKATSGGRVVLDRGTFTLRDTSIHAKKATIRPMLRSRTP
jgi:acyl dehydratase